jgi:hypothetical protein
MVAATRFSGLRHGRLAPQASWAAVWSFIFSYLLPYVRFFPCCERQNCSLYSFITSETSVTSLFQGPGLGPRLPPFEAAVHPAGASDSPVGPLQENTSRHEAALFLSSMIARNTTLCPAPFLPGELSPTCVLEGVTSAISPEGAQSVVLNVRMDCNCEVAVSVSVVAYLTYQDGPCI